MVEWIPEILGDLLVFQVRLAVKILGFNIAYTLIFRRFDDDHVSWEESVLVDFDEVTDFDVTPTNFFKGIGFATEAETERVVLDWVLLVTTVVFIGILAHRCEDDKDEGWEHSRLTVRDRYHLDCLHDSNK